MNGTKNLVSLVLNRRNVSPLIKPFLTLLKVSVGLKCVWTSSFLLMAKRGPLKTSVARKTIRYPAAWGVRAVHFKPILSQDVQPDQHGVRLVD